MKPSALRIAEKIEGMLSADVRLTPEMLHYMESMDGTTHPEEVNRLMADCDDCDSQSLFEMIFYPDPDQQAYLEPELEAGEMAEPEVQSIQAHLAAKRPRTRLIFPSGEETVRIVIPDSVLRSYVRRLNLTRRIAPPVAEAIENFVKDRSHALRVRVRMRNARFSFSEGNTAFLRSCLERLPVASETDIERLDLALLLLEQKPEKADVYTALMAMKHHCAEMIRQADNSEQRLRRQPVEVLIMQGINIPCISVEEAVRRMNRIDEIALQVFGKTETSGPLGPASESPVNLSAIDRARDLDKVIKILS